MLKLVDNFGRNDAGTLWGVRFCGLLVGFGAVLAAMCCVLFGFATFLDIMQHAYPSVSKSLAFFLGYLVLTYGLLRICDGLFKGYRFAQLGGIAWGVLLLLFCWLLVHDAREPSNPKAPDAQEMDGILFLLSALTALWLIGYLSTERVSLKFLGSRAEE